MEIALKVLIIFSILAIIYLFMKRLKWYINNDEHNYKDVILNIDALEKHARDVASDYKTGKGSKGIYYAFPRIESDRQELVNVYKRINEDLKSGKRIVPASEWLLDNFYIIEEQIKEIQHSLPKEYFEELPILVGGPYKGYPRAYGIALEMVAHTDGYVDEDTLVRFIRAFQSDTPLANGELWAIPHMLRIALIKNIRSIASHIIATQDQRKYAEFWADQLLQGVNEGLENTESYLDDLNKNMDTLETAFVEHLLQKLRDHGSEVSPVLHWLDEKLAMQDMTVERAIQSEHQDQAENQVSIGNSITSLRFLLGLKWSDVYEELSQVEQNLCQDPSGVYMKMDFASRDYYRHQVEILAKQYRISEVQVARKALECAQELSDVDGEVQKYSHIGYYLIDAGKAKLEERLGFTSQRLGLWNRIRTHNPFRFYVLLIGFISILIIGYLVYYAFRSMDTFNMLTLLIAAFAAFIPVVSIVIGIVNWAITRMNPPCLLPKLELKEGIPEQFKTMVVIPTLLSNEKRVSELIEQMEVFYLANQERNLHFALLGDLPDSETQTEDNDEKIIAIANQGIRELNERYGDEKLFFFFLRHRQWNISQGKWMGWERKRGALTEFNRLLKGKGKTSFNVRTGDLSILPLIKYVITLDADTQLPRDAAKRLIGTAAHPLNQPILNRDKTRVVEGYGILQPRMGITVTSASRSQFALVFSGQTGLDPYTTAVSDIYQDLFCEGIFTGKGIYDIDAFVEVLDGTIPVNSVLSHDLLEGCYARTGLVTDIELVDGYPSQYYSYAMRLHRWVRGDWQLLPWLKAMVKNEAGKMVKNPLTTVCKWKIIDNMRRSLLSPALGLLILLGFTVLPGSVWMWLGLAALTLAFPLLIDMIGSLATRYHGMNAGGRLAEIILETKTTLWQIMLNFVFLPHQAFLMMDAIVRTLTRIYFTRKKLLEWVTAADTERKFQGNVSSLWRKMGAASLFSVIFAAAVLVENPLKAALGVIIGLIWTLAPMVAYKVSKPYRKKVPNLSMEEINKLRLISRKTWQYFEDFCTEEDHWLPPDNYQEDPRKGIAHRTSPTNIGLAVIANIAARDLGYIGLAQMIDRIDHSVTSIEKLDKWNGHLYNWYDTITMTALKPLYVSSVDSGNLAAYLITTKQGLQETIHMPLVSDQLIKGLQDTLHLAGETKSIHISSQMKEGQNDGIVIRNRIHDFLQKEDKGLISWSTFIIELKEILEQYRYQKNNPLEKFSWNDKLYTMVFSLYAELREFVPWLNVWNDIPGFVLANNESFKMVQDKIKHLRDELQDKASLSSLVEGYGDILDSLSSVMISLLNVKDQDLHYDEAIAWLKKLELALARSHMSAKKRMNQIKTLCERIDHLVFEMDFSYLYDRKRELFSIGYNCETGELSNSYYDLLASEARQTSFIAIAKGDIPQKHWFRLGRSLTLIGDRRVLLSWSGTMFEYLMPLLLMRNYDYTLLDETYHSIVEGQKQYGEQRHVPWGVSESGYYAFDLNLNYQYKAFGIPRVGLKRGLVRDTVIAPYAAVLALPITPFSAYRNMEVFMQENMEGTYGFYEAIDYTPERLPDKHKSMIVKSYMVHHQGMSLLAFDNFLNNNVMQNRFHSVPIIKATELLLQERIPKRNVVIKEYDEAIPDMEKIKRQEIRANRNFNNPNTITPETHLLSNGSYSVMLTNSGSGFSMMQGTYISRWRQDVTQDNWGMYFFIQNLNSNEAWTAAYQPFGEMPEEYMVSFEPDRAAYQRRDGNIETRMEICVSPENNAEIRRISLTNHSQNSRVLQVTSYYEVVMALLNADIAHPAFSNLFVETEFVPEYNALIAARRPRSKEQSSFWVMHLVTVDGQSIGSVEYESDRLKFIGRGHSISDPVVIEPDYPLSNTAGAVLDPVMSLRRRVRINPGETVRLSFVVSIAETREEAIKVAEEYQNMAVTNRTFELAWTHSQVELRYLHIRANQANLYQYMASQILYLSPLRRKYAEDIQKLTKGQSSLWSYGISGDLPIVLLEVKTMDHIDLTKQVLTAHEYWRMKGLAVDLVIINEYGNSYEQPLQDRLRDIISMGHARDMQNKPGGVFLLQVDNISPEDKPLLYAAARFVIQGDKGTLTDQIKLEEPQYDDVIFSNQISETHSDGPLSKEEYLFDNRIGGFSKDGKEYIINLDPGCTTPLPWSNIISNPRFGFLITESGGGYTWAVNSRENKLTPWSNDPVVDPAGEIIYLRDEEEGTLWTVTPEPIRENIPYRVRHGQGYTVFEHNSHHIAQTTTVFVDKEDPVKFYWIRLTNENDLTKTLTVTFYTDFVLGVQRQMNAPYIVTGFDDDIDVMWAQNKYNEEFRDQILFLSAVDEEISYTGDRTEFIGRNGSLKSPAALRRSRLSRSIGAGYDPCGAIQMKVTLEPKKEKEIVFILGQTNGFDMVQELKKKYSNKDTVTRALMEIKSFWDTRLSKIQIKTPDPSMDILLNRWLLYQTWACRIWARTAFYQAGGAYGFRDQLQDVMALMYSEPAMARVQIIKSASHQFLEGDVQHWWHPPFRGVRTKITDDLLFLPYVTADYIEITADYSVLDEVVPYLEAEPLAQEEEDRYSIPKVSEKKGTIYEHCIKAIEKAQQFGEHGIPLMGTGDWNDGMNSVGDEGKGESIWLGWFLYATLLRFAPLAKMKNDIKVVERWSETANKLAEAIDRYGWDGSWYRRAYFDDGTPLGSEENTECRIDSISQSWAVISGAGKPNRIKAAMASLENHLIHREDGLIQLLTPPFDKSDLEPGYIKGYVPGVRENGGQYSHAAVWTIMAFAKMGNGDKAWDLFHLLNPINHARTWNEVFKYKVEPYVMAADVYAVYPHIGRGGWTWYTGSAGWMYRTGIEWIIGLKVRNDRIFFEPCIPQNWPGYEISFRYKETEYQIEVKNPNRSYKGIDNIILDEREQSDTAIHLVNDGNVHHVRIILGSSEMESN